MPPTRTGRPPASSRRTLEEAAAELFLEQGYDRTTVDDIARRAGVGRATFFNYFASKPDLLWLDVDEALDRLADALASVGADGPAPVLAGIQRAAAWFGPDRIPLAVTQREVMGTAADVAAAGYARAARLGTLLQRAMERATPHADPLVVAATSAALTGAIVSAWYGWAAAGVSRGDLEQHLSRALAVVRGGIDAAFR
jgi:AcrR family transcriptional regulator